MAQYDVIFVKNSAATGIEFAEQILAKPAASGYFLTQSTAGVLSWSKTLETPIINGTVSGTAIVTDLSSAPASGKIPDALAVYNKIENHLATNDAMVFKGTVGAGGTHEIIAFNSLSTYEAGWTYKVITAGTIKGKVVEVGDMLVSTVDRAGSGNVDADWIALQTNEGSVIGPVSSTNNRIAVFNGTSGKVIKEHTILATELLFSADGNVITAINAASGSINKTKVQQITYADLGGSLPSHDLLTGHSISGLTSGHFLKATGASTVGFAPHGLTAASVGAREGTWVPTHSEIVGFNTGVLAVQLNQYKGVSRSISDAIAAISTDVSNLETFSTANALKRTATKPATATSAGTLYDVHLDPAEGYMYVCLVGGATGTARWKRAALASW